MANLRYPEKKTLLLNVENPIDTKKNRQQDWFLPIQPIDLDLVNYSCSLRDVPSGSLTVCYWKMAIEIVSCPIKNGDFP